MFTLIKPVDLFKIANEARKKEAAHNFVEDLLPELEIAMEKVAQSGALSFVITRDSMLNRTDWLKNPYVCAALKKALEKEKFQVKVGGTEEESVFFKIQWNLLDDELENHLAELEVIETNEEAHYKNYLQVQYVESLCDGPFYFYHGTEESYPEIFMYIQKEFVPTNVKNVLEPVIRKAGFTKAMVEIEPYDKGERGYNELVLLLDLKLLTVAQVRELLQVVKYIVDPYVSAVEVEHTA